MVPERDMPRSVACLVVRANGLNEVFSERATFKMTCDTDHTTDHRRQILVVDDDPLFRSLMVSVLRHDFDVSVAADGADGFYKALDHVPDAAVLDIQMPGWDGIKTLKAFRSHPALAHVRVIVLTSDASRETVLAAIQAGADDYIIKTAFSRDDFRQKLDQLLQKPSSLEISLEIEPNSSAPLLPQRDDIEASLELVGSTVSSGKLVGWAGSEDLLQEAIDAWE
jgi:CheY-like chemotaxis protein